MAWDDLISGGAASPWNELRRLQQDMDRLFGQYRGEAETFPAVNVWSDRDNVVVTAELPGMDPKGIGLTVKGDLLTLHGERAADPESEGVVCHRSERWTGAFSRTLRLPFEVEQDKVRAQYRKGVLTITLPRSEASRPKQIRIHTED